MGNEAGFALSYAGPRRAEVRTSEPRRTARTAGMLEPLKSLKPFKSLKPQKSSKPFKALKRRRMGEPEVRRLRQNYAGPRRTEARDQNLRA